MAQTEFPGNRENIMENKSRASCGVHISQSPWAFLRFGVRIDGRYHGMTGNYSSVCVLFSCALTRGAVGERWRTVAECRALRELGNGTARLRPNWNLSVVWCRRLLVRDRPDVKTLLSRRRRRQREFPELFCRGRASSPPLRSRVCDHSGIRVRFEKYPYTDQVPEPAWRSSVW